MLCLVATSPARAGDPPLPPVEGVPDQWLKVDVVWKDTWEDTLAANPLDQWQKELAADPATAGAASRIESLRSIELLKAMIARFPARKDMHAAAYQQIANGYANLGCKARRNYYLLKIVREFSDRKDLAAAAYRDLIQLPFNSPVTAPSVLEWRFALDEILAQAQGGAIATDAPAVANACTELQRLAVAAMDYNELPHVLGRIETAAQKNPAALEAAGDFLAALGHYRAAAERYKKANSAALANLEKQNLLPRPQPLGLLRSFDLETRWQSFARSDGRLDLKNITPADMNACLLAAAKSGAVQQIDPARAASFWTVVTRELTQATPESLQALRREQQLAAGTIGPLEADELVALWRRYPLAPQIHPTLLEAAEDALRAGRPHWAAAAYDDVLRFCADEQLRREARAGLWLALSACGDAESLTTAAAAVPDDAPLPWRGAIAPAAKIKTELLKSIAPSKPVVLTALAVRRLSLTQQWLTPPGAESLPELALHRPWPVAAVWAYQGDLMAASPGRLGRFDAQGAPSVMMSSGGIEAGSPMDLDANMPMPPIRGDGAPWTEYHRWPIATTCQRGRVNGRDILCRFWDPAVPEMITGIDAASGRTLWATTGREEWGQLRPLSQPCVADGLVFVLAMQAHPEDAEMSVVCLDLGDGTIRWKRTIGWQGAAATVLARGARAISVYQGSVYCVTSSGLAARLDVRDGTLDWVSRYDGALPQARPAPQFSREGSSPLVAGDKVLAAPRDHSGVIAFDRRSGKIVWETFGAASDRILGAGSGKIIGINAHWLAALDIATGRQTWCRRFDESTACQGVLAGTDAVVLTGRRLERISLAAGSFVEHRELGPSNAVDATMLPDGTLVEIHAPDIWTAPPGPAVPASPVRLGMKKVWSLALRNFQ
ncbi:MAG: PQQ-like beta-propeller repeat protein, partial [Planctomycetaceae bacterium]|nr:PQQ-like beta-propeller repeat protein [Planctomycetaceae bacterium]